MDIVTYALCKKLINSVSKTIDYNDLLNTPITNANGTEDSPIVLNTLDYGNYILTGNYQYTSIADIQTTDVPVLVQITQDAITSEKIATFEVYEDGEACRYSITFYDDDTCLQDKVIIANQKEVVLFFNDDANLPDQGQEEILYVTDNSIYKWNGTEYTSIGASEWGSCD